jgi:VWFA-related protein
VRSLLLLAIATILVAQDSHFAVRSRLVVVPVNVTDVKGRPVPDLAPAEFEVLDDGRRQKASVDTIDTGVAPIALIIAVESAGISMAALENVRRVGAMIQPLVTGERGCAGLLSFDERLTWLQECTKDADALVRGFQKLRPTDRQRKARLLDAASSALDRLQRRENARRVLLLISETRDRGSETRIEEIIAAAQAAGVSVYGVTYSAYKTSFASKAPVGEQRPAKTPTTPSEAMGTINGAPPGPGNPKIPIPEQRVDILGGLGELAHMTQHNVIDPLVKSTGGMVFSFTRLKGLEDAIRKFGEELNSQYVLSFVPDRHEVGYHSLAVRVARPGTFQVRARPGYRNLDGRK